MRNITYSNIFRRERVLNSSINNVSNEDALDKNCALKFSRLKKSRDFHDADAFLCENRTNPKTCTKYLPEMVTAVSMFPGNDKLAGIFENALPFVQSGYESIPINEMGLSDKNKDDINTQIIINRTCDRILGNHKNISKSYDINAFAERANNDMISDKCASIVNKFNLPVYGKINITAEETCYLLDKRDVSFNRNNVIARIVDYYTIKEDCSGFLDKITRSIENNKYIREEAPIDVDASNPINKSIELFKIMPQKNSTPLSAIIEEIMQQVSYVFEDSLFAFLNLLSEILISSDDEALCTDICGKVVPDIYNYFCQYKLYDKDAKYLSEYAIKAIKKCQDSLIPYKRFDDEKVVDRLDIFSKVLDTLNDQFTDINNMAYTNYNIIQQNITPALNESDSNMSLDDYLDFKDDNFKQAIKTIGDTVEGSTSIVKDAPDVKITVWKENSIFDAITNDNTIDFTVCRLDFGKDVDATLNDDLTNLCKSINESTRMIIDGFVCYYESTLSSSSIHVKDVRNIIKLNEAQEETKKNNISEEDAYDIFNIEHLGKHSTALGFKDEDAIKYFSNPTIDADEFSSFVEICSIANLDKDIIKTIYESVLNNLNKDAEFYQKNNYLIESYEVQNAPYDIMIEAAEDLHKIIYEDYKTYMRQRDDFDKDFDSGDYDDNDYAKDAEDHYGIKSDSTKKKSSKNEDEDDDNYDEDNDNYDDSSDDDNDDEEKNQKTQDSNIEDRKKNTNGFMKAMTNCKLYLMGLRKKIKDFDSKMQAAGKNMDAAFSRFIKSIQDAETNDRRANIIKGNVIPSFSQCCKIAITTAGAGFVGKEKGGNLLGAVAAAATLYANFAINKKLDQKERALLLDDLEVELEMLDKEIQEADSRGQMKKLRALLTTKKQIQRQYQRIKYHMRVGKDLIPGSDMGVPGYNG